MSQQQDRQSSIEDALPQVFVVDDSAGVCALLVRALERAGFRCGYQSNASEAAAHLLEDDVNYCVIVTDLRMPMVDGIELTRRLRAAGQSTPVVMCTSSYTADAIAAALEAGCNAIVDKGRGDVAEIIVRYVQHFCETS